MKVLLLNGSPNQQGCTYTALEEVAKALQNDNIETEIFHIGTQPIRGCMGCKKCRDNGNRCIFDDVVNKALDKVEQADGLVLGSPVYYASANGSFVAFLDRLFYAGDCFAYKPGACVVSARRAGTTAALEQLVKYLTISHMPVVSAQYWPMVHGNTPAEVRQDEEGLQTMRMLGRNMAWLLRCLEAGKQAGILPPKGEEKVRTNFIR